MMIMMRVFGVNKKEVLIRVEQSQERTEVLDLEIQAKMHLSFEFSVPVCKHFEAGHPGHMVFCTPTYLLYWLCKQSTVFHTFDFCVEELSTVDL